MTSRIPSVPAFPVDARRLLPHAGPMCCIDRLLSSSKTAAVAEVMLTDGHSLLDGDTLDRPGYVELAAQTAGAMQGFDQYIQGLPPKFGYLVGVQDFYIHADARRGDRLRLEVSIEAELGEVTVLSARVCCEDALLAEGRLKVYVPE